MKNPELLNLQKGLSVQSLVISHAIPMFTSYQDYYTLGGEVRISREKMMSICLTWFPISGLGKPKLYQNLGVS